MLGEILGFQFSYAGITEIIYQLCIIFRDSGHFTGVVCLDSAVRSLGNSLILPPKDKAKLFCLYSVNVKMTQHVYTNMSVLTVRKNQQKLADDLVKETNCE